MQNTIYLHPLELSGFIKVNKLYLIIEKEGTPEDASVLLELAVYRRNDSDNGFTKEVQLGPFSFNEAVQIYGDLRAFSLATAQELSAGQHYIAFLYKYTGPFRYLIHVCPAGSVVYPDSGIYLPGVASSLPANVFDADFSSYMNFLPWIELEGEL